MFISVHQKQMFISVHLFLMYRNVANPIPDVSGSQASPLGAGASRRKNPAGW